jgi:hypothetical protein
VISEQWEKEEKCRFGSGWEGLAMMACYGVWVVWDWKGDGSRNDWPQANGMAVEGEEKDE